MMPGVVAFVALLLLAAVVALALWLWRRPVRPLARRDPWDAEVPGAGVEVVLDLIADDPDDPAVQRLVREASSRALHDDPTIDRIAVIDAEGRVLGRETRGARRPEVALPEHLHEPHARRSRTPSVVQRPRPRPAPAPATPADLVVTTPALAERLALPDQVRLLVRHPDRAVDVVRAILEAAGLPVEIDGDVVVSDDVAIAVVDARIDPQRALTHGFFRIQETGAPRGIVLRLGHVDPRLVRRREAAAPHVRHVGTDALQRMADAVAVGADPIAFAAAPAVRG